MIAVANGPLSLAMAERGKRSTFRPPTSIIVSKPPTKKTLTATALPWYPNGENGSGALAKLEEDIRAEHVAVVAPPPALGHSPTLSPGQPTHPLPPPIDVLHPSASSCSNLFSPLSTPVSKSLSAFTAEATEGRVYPFSMFMSVRKDASHTPHGVLCWAIRYYRRTPAIKIPEHLQLNVNDPVEEEEASRGALGMGLKAPLRIRPVRQTHHKVLSILSRVTPQSYWVLSEELISLPLRQTDDGELRGVVNVFFEKAVLEHAFSGLYARLVKDVCTMKESEKELDKELRNKLLCNRMRLELIEKCKEEFKRPIQLSADDLVDRTTGAPLCEEDIEMKRTRLKQRLIGNVKFVGELYKMELVPEDVVEQILTILVGNYDTENPTAREDHVYEVFFSLMSCVGGALVASRPQMVRHFMTITEAIRDSIRSNRVRFFMMNLIDLANSGWPTKDDEYLAPLNEASRRENENGMPSGPRHISSVSVHSLSMHSLTSPVSPSPSDGNMYNDVTAPTNGLSSASSTHNHSSSNVNMAHMGSMLGNFREDPSRAQQGDRSASCMRENTPSTGFGGGFEMNSALTSPLHQRQVHGRGRYSNPAALNSSPSSFNKATAGSGRIPHNMSCSGFGGMDSGIAPYTNGGSYSPPQGGCNATFGNDASPSESGLGFGSSSNNLSGHSYQPPRGLGLGGAGTTATNPFAGIRRNLGSVATASDSREMLAPALLASPLSPPSPVKESPRASLRSPVVHPSFYSNPHSPSSLSESRMPRMTGATVNLEEVTKNLIAQYSKPREEEDVHRRLADLPMGARVTCLTWWLRLVTTDSMLFDERKKVCKLIEAIMAGKCGMPPHELAATVIDWLRYDLERGKYDECPRMPGNVANIILQAYKMMGDGSLSGELVGQILHCGVFNQLLLAFITYEGKDQIVTFLKDANPIASQVIWMIREPAEDHMVLMLAQMNRFRLLPYLLSVSNAGDTTTPGTPSLRSMTPSTPTLRSSPLNDSMTSTSRYDPLSRCQSHQKISDDVELVLFRAIVNDNTSVSWKDEAVKLALHPSGEKARGIVGRVVQVMKVIGTLMACTTVSGGNGNLISFTNVDEVVMKVMERCDSPVFRAAAVVELLMHCTQSLGPRSKLVRRSIRLSQLRRVFGQWCKSKVIDGPEALALLDAIDSSEHSLFTIYHNSLTDITWADALTALGGKRM